MANEHLITQEDIQGMVKHHLDCPPEGYLGSGYGSDIKSLLHNPQASGLAESFIAKMKLDIPVLELAGSSINVYSTDEGIDKKSLVIDVAGQAIIAGG